MALEWIILCKFEKKIVIYIFIYFYFFIFIRMSNFKRVFLETIFHFKVRIRNILEMAEPIYLKFGGLNLHKKGSL